MDLLFDLALGEFQRFESAAFFIKAIEVHPAGGISHTTLSTLDSYSYNCLHLGNTGANPCITASRRSAPKLWDPPRDNGC